MDVFEAYRMANICSKRLNSTVNSLLADICGQIGVGCLTAQQYLILEALDDVSWWDAYAPRHKELESCPRPSPGMVLQQDLAGYLASEPTTVCACAKRLEAAGGYISRQANQSGKWRAVWVGLSPEGKRVFSLLRPRLISALKGIGFAPKAADMESLGRLCGALRSKG